MEDQIDALKDQIRDLKGHSDHVRDYEEYGKGAQLERVVSEVRKRRQEKQKIEDEVKELNQIIQNKQEARAQQESMIRNMEDNLEYRSKCMEIERSSQKLQEMQARLEEIPNRDNYGICTIFECGPN
eukprot:SAG31_NODE_2020_length_6659_cov_1.685976_11_plen_127_part_00